MSSKHFAVQFRSMRTAIHNIAVFNNKTNARMFCMFIEEDQELPEEHDFNYDLMEYSNVFEIDHRKPPTNVQGYTLEYINRDNIPDVYNF